MKGEGACACESCTEKLAIVDHWWGRADAGTLLGVLAVWGVDDVDVGVVGEPPEKRRVCVWSISVEQMRWDDDTIPGVGRLLGKGATHGAALRSAYENGVAWRSAEGDE